jgi:uncharacterized protein with PIN domain
MTEADGVRRIWGTDFEMVRCSECGRYFAPKAQLEYISKLSKMPIGHFYVCNSCR